ncbi:glutaredoxin-like protein [Leptomonas seymouri]|uniref:Glutaredoxin-like protein n=1 Tax=Leptomonas seymouri TaxID=5684 RepID=A0A0N1IIF5_LEPSE|nr:glutaredoxin-like protein [Leptomonas seymouri]|eukprot:KPI84695.1 glutaredoxin-like protein [Leptomonas seymouri]
MAAVTVNSLISLHKVVMFSWVHCPYCVRAKEILKPLVTDMKVYEVEEMQNGEDLRKQIYDTYKHETVPAIFINGEFIGGCSDLQALQKSGELAKKLA